MVCKKNKTTKHKRGGQHIDDDSMYQLDISKIHGNDDDDHNMMDESFTNPIDESNLTDNEENINQGSFHLSDLSISNSLVNTRKDNSFGGGKKRRRKTTKKNKNNKGKKSKKSYKNKIRKNIKRQHGGFVGDNGSDMEEYGKTNPYSVDKDSDPRF